MLICIGVVDLREDEGLKREAEHYRSGFFLPEQRGLCNKKEDEGEKVRVITRILGNKSVRR